MLHDASQDNDDDIQLKYRTYRGVFNLRRLETKTKVKVATQRELLFADDCALNSNTEVEMQQCLNHFYRACATLVSPSAPGRQKSCTSQHRKRRITRFIYDKKVPVKLKSKLYKTVVRPAMVASKMTHLDAERRGRGINILAQ